MSGQAAAAANVLHRFLGMGVSGGTPVQWRVRENGGRRAQFIWKTFMHA
jgi:hypothetical protein